LKKKRLATFDLGFLTAAAALLPPLPASEASPPARRPINAADAPAAIVTADDDAPLAFASEADPPRCPLNERGGPFLLPDLLLRLRGMQATF